MYYFQFSFVWIFDNKDNWRFKKFNFGATFWGNGCKYQKSYNAVLLRSISCLLYFFLRFWATGVVIKKLFNSGLSAHRLRVLAKFGVCSSYGVRETLCGYDRQTNGQAHRRTNGRTSLNRFFSTRWSNIYILYRVSHVSFDLLCFPFLRESGLKSNMKIQKHKNIKINK